MAAVGVVVALVALPWSACALVAPSSSRVFASGPSAGPLTRRFAVADLLKAEASAC